MAKSLQEEDSVTKPLRINEEANENNLPNASESFASEAFGQLLRHVGEGGKYQWILFTVTSFCGLFFAFHNLAAAFLAATPNFRCDFPNTNFSYVKDNRTHYLQNHEELWELPKCEYYETNFDHDKNHSVISEYPEPHLVKHTCEAWIYDDSVYKSTIVTEWDLVCDKRWMMTSAQATYMAGVLVGAVVLSELSDMYGRRTIVLISAVGFFICAVCISFSTHFLMFICLRFLVAFFGSGMFLPNFVLVMEMVGPKYRTTMGMLYQVFFGVGFCVLPALAYFIRDWRTLQLVISVPSVVLLLYFKILPESPRWLLSQGRDAEALKILRQMAKMNGKSLPEEKELQDLISKMRRQKKQESVMAKVASFFKNQAKLLRTPIMRRRCLIIYFSWFVVSMIYYGLTFSGGNINASIYLMVFLSGIVEIPSYFLAIVTMDKFGRRLNISFSFIICGIACMLILAVPKDMVWLNMTFASVGKFFNSIAFAIAYMYSAELVPTQVRNIAVGTSSMWARVGSVLAPFIVDSLGQIHYVIPSTIFGVLSLMAGFLDLLLPETGKSPLPETIEEVEAMDR